MLGPLALGGEDGFAKVGRAVLELVEWHGDGFDIGVTLLSEAEDGFIEQDAFVLFGVHAHEAFHEILPVSFARWPVRGAWYVD